MGAVKQMTGTRARGIAGYSGIVHGPAGPALKTSNLKDADAEVLTYLEALWQGGDPVYSTLDWQR